MRLLDSQGPITNEASATNKALIEKFAKHSREYHNPRDDVTRSKANGDEASNNLGSIVEKLDIMDRRITKMGKSIHAIQVG